MNFFTAIRTAEFSAKLFVAAGFDFAAALKAGNESALKAHIDAEVAKAVAAAKPDAKLADEVATLNAAITSAKATNDVIAGSLAAVGINFPDAAAGATTEQQIATNKTAIEAHIKIRAQGVLATTGHPALKTGAPDTGAQKTLTRKAFDALGDKEKSAFIKDGGRLTD